MLWGEAAEGKSSLVKQYADSINYRLIDLRPALMADPGDLTGMPRVIVDPTDPKNMNKAKTVYVMPNWFPTQDNEKGYKGTVLFLDEFNRMDQSVFHAIFQLVYDRRIMEHVLPKNTLIVLAGNPPTENYQVSSLEDDALWTRFAHFNVSIDIDEWVKWAIRNDLNEDIIGFLGSNPKMAAPEPIASSKNTSTGGPQISSTKLMFGRRNKRTWPMLSSFVNCCMEDDQGRLLWANHAVEIAQGFIGEKAAPIFIAFRKENKYRPLTGTEILDQYREHRDRMQLICGKKSNSIHGDSLSTSIHMLIGEIERRWDSTHKANSHDKNFVGFMQSAPSIGQNFLDFLSDLPHDHRALLNDAIHRDQPGTTPGTFMAEFARWMKDNSKAKDYADLIRSTTQISQASQKVLVGS